MRLEAIELHRVSMPLIAPYRVSFGILKDRGVILVRAVTDDGYGWSECVALAEPNYSPEYIDGAVHVIEHHLAPRLFAAGDVTAADVERVLGNVKGHQMAKAALECAVLDAELRASSTSLAAWLGATRDRVPAGVSLGITPDTGELLDKIAAYIDLGYVRVKLKIEPGSDIEPVRAVRERFADLPIQVDANAAYRREHIDHLRQLDAFGLLLIEQPFPDEDLLGHAELARRIETPVCLDESLTSADTTAQALDLGACSIVNIKIGRVGGMIESKRIHDLCAERGVPVWCGGMHESGVGRAACVGLSALPNFTIPGDPSASDRYFHRDVTEPFVLEDGHLRVPRGPGIGVEPLDDALAELRTDLRTLGPRTVS